MSKIFIYGSCVSRDAFNFLDDSHDLIGYVARQSLISAMSGQTKLLPGEPLDSAFQSKMVEGDLASNLVPAVEIHAENLDLLIIDMTDERLGVHKLPDNTFVTHSVELVRSKRLNNLSPVPGTIQIGTERHTIFWQNAARKFYSKLDQLGLRDKTLIINTPWAVESFEGTDVPGYRDFTTEKMNRHLDDFANFIRGLGYRVVDMPTSLAVSSAKHQWGIAPFHYGEPAYLWIRDQVQSALGPGEDRAE
jgi:hypothetical protein